MVILTLMFFLGLSCGIEGGYSLRAFGAPAYAGIFTAWCDLREVAPYAFGYMMCAKIGTGIVAELGSMRVVGRASVELGAAPHCRVAVNFSQALGQADDDGKQ